jgi:hypothetical protein
MGFVSARNSIIGFVRASSVKMGIVGARIVIKVCCECYECYK